MKKVRKKSVALVLALGVTGIVGAAAASFNGLNASSLGSEDTVVASCDTDGIEVGFTTSYSSDDQRYEVSSVDLSEVDDACDGLDFDLTVTDGADVLDSTSGVVSLSGNSFSVSVSGVAAEDVEGLSLVISG